MRTISKSSKTATITRPTVKPVPAISAHEQTWQREVYEADPVGGSASRY